MNIAGIEIGPGQPCRTVAELSNAHNGKLETAFRLIDAAKAAGADFVKLQAYTPGELVRLRGDGPAPDPWGAEGWSMRDLYEKARTPLEWLPELAARCDAVGIPWFASAFGPESIAACGVLDCAAYKMASLDRGAAWLRAALMATGKPLLQSVPDPDSRDGYLYCPPGYPQKRFGFGNAHFCGFSYHGTEPLVPLLAWANGAYLIECHLQLADEPSDLERTVSLNEMEFRQMVDMLRLAEECEP